MYLWIKRVVAALILIFIVVQFFPGERPVVQESNPDDIHFDTELKAEMSTLLRSACYDCHSNETQYPWYSRIVPVSWLVNHDIEEGREELNFSVWKSYSVKKKHHKLEEIIEEVSEGEMPMPIYKLTHAKARLSDEQIEELKSWTKAEMTKMAISE